MNCGCSVNWLKIGSRTTFYMSSVLLWVLDGIIDTVKSLSMATTEYYNHLKALGKDHSPDVSVCCVSLLGSNNRLQFKVIFEGRTRNCC